MENQPDILTDLQPAVINRRQLLPWWMKIFCWIFIVFAFGALACLLLGLFGLKVSLAFYGFETMDAFSPIGLLVIAIAVFKGFAAFALWFEKDYAINIGRIDAIIGIVMCTVSMVILPLVMHTGFTIRLELILLIPYLIKLNSIRESWN